MSEADGKAGLVGMVMHAAYDFPMLCCPIYYCGPKTCSDDVQDLTVPALSLSRLLATTRVCAI